MRITTTNISDYSDTITVSPEQPDPKYIIENVQIMDRKKVFRSSNVEAQTIELTFDSPQTISAIILGRHNFSKEVTYRIRLIYDELTTRYDTGVTLVGEENAATDLWMWGEFTWGSIAWGADKLNNFSTYYNLPIWLDQTYTDIYTIIIDLAWDITPELAPLLCNNNVILCNDNTILCNAVVYEISGGEPVDPNIEYFEIGRLIIGEYVEPTYDVAPGISLTWKENITQIRPSSGTLHSDYATTNKEIVFDLSVIPTTDFEPLHDKLVDYGLNKDFYASIFPIENNIDKKRDYSGIFKFTKVPKYDYNIGCYYKSQFTMEEV